MIMKKLFLLLILITGIGNITIAQDVNQLLKNASKTGNKQKIDIKKSFKKLCKEMEVDFKDIPVVGGIDFMERYDLSECKNDEKQGFIQYISNLKDSNGYETLISTKKDTDNTRIMIKKKKNYISDLLIIHTDSEEPNIVRFSGKIKMDAVDGLIDESEKR